MTTLIVLILLLEAIEEVSLFLHLLLYIDIISLSILLVLEALHQVMMQKFIDSLGVQEASVLDVKQVSH